MKKFNCLFNLAYFIELIFARKSKKNICNEEESVHSFHSDDEENHFTGASIGNGWCLFVFLLIFITSFSTETVFSQSLESQLKIIFGDALETHGKNDFSRALGKAISTSGAMQYDMERIKAQNNQTITINHRNLPPNTYIGNDNQVYPKEGYAWEEPSSSTNYNVVPIYSASRATLPQYDLNYLKKFYGKQLGITYGSTLMYLFTYNWYSDLNGNNQFDFNEFNGIKRTFFSNEPICFAIQFRIKCGSNSFGEPLDKMTFLIQLFDDYTGKLLGEEYYTFSNGEGSRRFADFIRPECLGDSFPVGRYILAVRITSSQKIRDDSITFLQEKFEVLK